MNKIKRKGWLLAVLAAGACAQDEPGRDVASADVLLRGGDVYTVDDSAPRAQAVAIDDGLIVFVGTNADAQAYVGADTRIMDLDGATVMPGIVDAHVHAVRGAVRSVYGCNFPFSATPEDIAAAVAACVERWPDAQWIRGGQWGSGFFERHEIDSPRQFLDAVAGDKAIYLADDALHNAWVNSKALELAGITKATPDPAGGRFERDEDGVPNGLLIETAPKIVASAIPDYTQAQYQEAAAEFSRIANRYGITAAKDAGPTAAEMAAYRDADLAGQLTLHIATSIRTPYGHREAPLDYAAIDALRERFATAHVHTAFVKIFLDGVPTPARTAAMLAPYLPDELHGADFDGGPLHVAGDLLAVDLIALDARGYTVKLHAAGDRSVRVALDAIEAARVANGPSGLRHELAHAGYVDPADIGRFAKLDAVADLSPVIWHPSPIIDAVVSALGSERGERYWPVRDLLDSGAPVLAGSDWPAAVPDANPWVGIEALVTRRDPRGKTAGTLWAEQAISLEEALRIYTLDGARALRLDEVTGSIRTGKSADLIVLNHNLFDIDADKIGETRVRFVFFEGRQVL